MSHNKHQPDILLRSDKVVTDPGNTAKAIQNLPVTMPSNVESSSKNIDQSIIVTEYLPEWMYFPPDFIHDQSLEIDIEKDLEALDSIKALRAPIKEWYSMKCFDSPESPIVVDAGAKKGLKPELDFSYNSGKVKIQRHYDADELLKYLIQPRTLEKAKKRLIEVNGFDKESILVCWLASSPLERPFFLEFYQRHEASENYFGKSALTISLRFWIYPRHLILLEMEVAGRFIPYQDHYMTPTIAINDS